MFDRKNFVARKMECDRQREQAMKMHRLQVTYEPFFQVAVRGIGKRLRSVKAGWASVRIALARTTNPQLQ